MKEMKSKLVKVKDKLKEPETNWTSRFSTLETKFTMVYMLHVGDILKVELEKKLGVSILSIRSVLFYSKSNEVNIVAGFKEVYNLVYSKFDILRMKLVSGDKLNPMINNIEINFWINTSNDVGIIVVTTSNLFSKKTSVT
jgi:hypothetical protein